MTSKRYFALFAVLMLAALPALAKPSFTGTWKINPSKSTFGQMPAPDSMVYTVTQDDAKISYANKQSSQMGDFEMKSAFTLDGKESVNEGFGGSQMKGNAKWDGDTLVIETKGQFGDNEFTMTQKWTLAADGKSLSITQSIKSSMGEFEQKMVFDKQ